MEGADQRGTSSSSRNGVGTRRDRSQEFPDWQHLEEILGWTPERHLAYGRALVHASFVNEHHRRLAGHMIDPASLDSNERLEFLGDAVLEVVVSEYLFRTFPELPEGELTKVRAAVVSTNSLATIARELRLGELLLLGRGERLTGGAERPTVLEDAFEALCGAIWIAEGEQGVQRARDFIIRCLAPAIDQAVHGANRRDAKNRLQEWAQRYGHALGYVLVAARGPDHAKEFDMEVTIDGHGVARGTGHSKKEAELNAAAEALKLLGAGEVHL